jgi:hypothetical protein
MFFLAFSSRRNTKDKDLAAAAPFATLPIATKDVAGLR